MAVTRATSARTGDDDTQQQYHALHGEPQSASRQELEPGGDCQPRQREKRRLRGY